MNKIIGKNFKNIYLWKGGISKSEYPKEFNRKLKKSIFLRDNYTCQICKKYKIICQTHHIDYDKKNNNINNLTTLCRPCHAKTNQNREYWTKKLKSKINE